MKARVSIDFELQDRLPSCLGRRRALPLLAGGLLVATALAGACDQTFEPLAPIERHYSVFGYLDASADTQWIRVMPIRTLKPTSAGPSSDVVTLEEHGTGRMIPLQDSVFRFDYRPPAPLTGSAWAHNFWTSQPIEPGARYTLSIRGDSGEVATAEITIPPPYHVELSVTRWGLADQLRVTGLKQLPFVAQKIRFQDGCGASMDTVWYKAGPGADDSYTILVRRDSVEKRGDRCGSPRILGREFWLVGSDSSWPSGVGSGPAGVGAAILSTNVENAVGFVVGVLTRSFPYGECTFKTASSAPPEYCTLNYDLSSTSLEGTVSETRCGDGPIDSVTVTLTELDADPAEVRRNLTTPDGHYRIAALVPGTRYALLVIGKGLGGFAVYDVVEDTLTFTPGERRERDFGLRWLPSCDLPRAPVPPTISVF